MLHDVTFDVWDAAASRSHRHTIQVDADGGDDAASKGAVDAALLSSGAPLKIIAIAPAGAAMVIAAAGEGEDA